MRKQGAFPIALRLSKVAAVALLASVAVGCSGDFSRVAQNPFSNPFGDLGATPVGTDQIVTGGVPKAVVPRAPSPAAPLPQDGQVFGRNLLPAPTNAPGLVASYAEPSVAAPIAAPIVKKVTQKVMAPASAPIVAAAAPMVVPAITETELPTPPAMRSAKKADPAARIVTAALPKVAAPAKADSLSGWTGQGGMPFTLTAGDSLPSIAKRFGIPLSAILAVNGLKSSSDAKAGQPLILPVRKAEAKPMIMLGGAMFGLRIAQVPFHLEMLPIAKANAEEGEAPPPVRKKKKVVVSEEEAAEAQPAKKKQKVAVTPELEAPVSIKPAKKPKPTSKVAAAEETEPQPKAKPKAAPASEAVPAKPRKKVVVAEAEALVPPVSKNRKVEDADASDAKSVKKKRVVVADNSASETPAKPKTKTKVAASADADEPAKPKVAAKAKPKAVAVADDDAPVAKAKPKPVKVAVAESDDDAPKKSPAKKPAVKKSAAKTAIADASAPAKPKKLQAKPKSEPKATEPNVKETQIAAVKAVKPAKPVKTVPAQDVNETEVATADALDPATTGGLHPAETVTAPEPAGFRWPARGRVIQGFGETTIGRGIKIAVPEGTMVKASRAGRVIYAGEEVKGYGKLVLIRHEDGYVSAYGNNSEILVKRGQDVARGEDVALSGATGDVSAPMLHFELRKGQEPVDPMAYLSQ
jgi:murein DD-endopeptidase MepM/ murein hydrolase activator NlpD